MKVLIIDDEAHIRQMMRLTLEAAAYEIGQAASGEEGLTQFGDGSEYDAVLLDQKMPGIDGLETLKRLKERVPHACVIMVTAFGSIELAVDAMKLGATDFLRKPMTPEMLRGSVAAALAGRVRPPIKEAAAPGEPSRPPIQRLTLNGFRILRVPESVGKGDGEHIFQVTHFPDGAQFTVTVTINPEAVARVARLTKRNLQPGGAFWRMQAERLISAYLWSAGKAPENNRMRVDDVTRDDIDMAAAWDSD